MLCRARNVKVRLLWMVLFLIFPAVSGCGPKSGNFPTYMRPELLYLSDQPYGRLYVEVDTVEGVEVPEKLLDGLRIFLSKHCSKPDGIEIVRDDPIPLSEVKEVSMDPALVLYLDGPDPNERPRCAYLQLFFYDTKTAFKRVPKNPHVSLLCPSTIYYNVDYCRSRQDKVADFMLKHEAGHVLGLTRSTAHGDGSHCSNGRCLMNASPGWWSGFFGLLLGVRIERELCVDCRDDLERAKSEHVGRELEFKGPFLIRHENGYSVASLPYCDLIIPAALEDEFNWQEALAKVKEEVRTIDYVDHRKKGGRIRGLCRPDETEEPPESAIDYPDIFNRAAKDPNPFVRRYAVAELDRIRKEQDQ